MLPAERTITTVSDTGLPWSLIREIAIRWIDNAPGFAAVDILRRCGAGPELSSEILAHLLDEGIVLAAAPARLDHAHYLVRNTLSRPGYAGILPVPLEDWRAQTSADAIVEQSATVDRIREAFSDMRGIDELIDTLCDHAGLLEHALMVGPEDAGYVMIAKRLAGLHPGPISVPVAVLVDGRILTLHDPEIHGSDNSPCPDPRYMRAGRPCIIVQDPQPSFQEIRTSDGVAKAPLGMLASGGILMMSIRGKATPELVQLLDQLGLSGSGIQRATLNGGRLDLPASYCLTCEAGIGDIAALGACRLAFGLRIDIAHPGEFEASLDFIAQMRKQGIHADKASVVAFLSGARRDKMTEIPRETVTRIVNRVCRLRRAVPEARRSSRDLVSQAWSNEATLKASGEPAG